MRSLFVLAYTCSGLMQVFAQQLPPDSSIKQINLHDVVVMAADSSLSEAFTFYRTGKLSSTEDILSRMEGVNLTKRGAFGLEPMLRAYSAGKINYSALKVQRFRGRRMKFFFHVSRIIVPSVSLVESR
jgi:iron complex outermembrane receptor protein